MTHCWTPDDLPNRERTRKREDEPTDVTRLLMKLRECRQQAKNALHHVETEVANLRREATASIAEINNFQSKATRAITRGILIPGGKLQANVL